MKAISLWQPWAWAVLCLGKDVENRVWRTNHRGPLILHAAQRRAGVGSFTSETSNRYWGEGRAELRVTEWRRTDRTDDGKVLAKKLEGNP